MNKLNYIITRLYKRVRAVVHVFLYGYISTPDYSKNDSPIKQAAPPKMQFENKTTPLFSENFIDKLKNKFGYPFKLNLGCGDKEHLGQDYIHIDIRKSPITDLVTPVESTGLPSQSCTVIIAWNVLEHVSWRKTQLTLQHWFDLLKPGGRLALSIPNLEKLAIDILESDSMIFTNRNDRGGHIIEHLYGGQDYDGNYHVAGWKPSWLEKELKSAGFLIENIGDGNLKDFGFHFNMSAGTLGGANGWDMLAIAQRPTY